jgi:uncharacterized membrane protein
MDRMLVVVFDSEDKAYEGKRALSQLDSDGGIGLFAYAVVAKNADGTSTVKQGEDVGPLGTVFGTALGSLIGVLFGPAGAAIGAVAGLAGGTTADLAHAGVGEDFIDDVSRTLLPNKVAVVAEVDEDWTFPVDNRMDALGGIVFRRAMSDVRHTVHQDNVAPMKADLAQLKAEHAQAHANRKVRLQERIDELDSKIQAQLQAAKERRQAAERTIQAQLQAVKERRQAAERTAQVKAQILKAKVVAAVAGAEAH